MSDSELDFSRGKVYSDTSSEDEAPKVPKKGKGVSMAAGPVVPPVLLEKPVPEAMPKKTKIAESKQALCGFLHVQAGDWSEYDASFVDTKFWLQKVVENKTDLFNLILRDIDSHPSLNDLFKPPTEKMKILSICSHTAPYPAGMRSMKKGDPRQLMSFKEGDFKPFPMVAAALNRVCAGEDKKFNVVLLGCCQGDRFLPLIRKIIKKGGLVVYYGDNEDEDDGVAAGNIAEVWESFVENLCDAVDPMDFQAAFEQSYVQSGLLYLAPTGKEHDKDRNGDYTYCELVLDQSINTAMKQPGFIRNYTYAGNLRAEIDGVSIVTDELKARRAEAFATRKAELDAEARAAAKPAGKGKDRAGAK